MERGASRNILIDDREGSSLIAEVNYAQTSASAELLSALELVATPNPLPSKTYWTTTRRTLSRRGVIWLGQTCNLRCSFCYFLDRIESKVHPEHAFMSIDKAKEICNTIRDHYGNTAVDIEGGEPTIYPHILRLIKHCVGIKLYPTLITNAIVLADFERCRSFKEVGLRDFKVSIHGLGSVHDNLVGRRGAHRLQMRALRNMRELGIPFRFNVVLTPPAITQLEDLAKLAIASGAIGVNWLGFNPHEDQQSNSAPEVLIPNFTKMRRPLSNALDILGEAGIETNVRYVPHCMIEPRHRKSNYHFQQLFYDHGEWDLASWSWTTLQPQRESGSECSPPITTSSLRWWVRLAGPFSFFARFRVLRKFVSSKEIVNTAGLLKVLYKIQSIMKLAPEFFIRESKSDLYNKVARLNARVNCDSVHTAGCRLCAARPICSGIYKEYAELFGTEEVRFISGDKIITDSTHYIRDQHKIVEKEDEDWAI